MRSIPAYGPGDLIQNGSYELPPVHQAIKAFSPAAMIPGEETHASATGCSVSLSPNGYRSTVRTRTTAIWSLLTGSFGR